MRWLYSFAKFANVVSRCQHWKAQSRSSYLLKLVWRNSSVIICTFSRKLASAPKTSLTRSWISSECLFNSYINIQYNQRFVSILANRPMQKEKLILPFAKHWPVLMVHLERPARARPSCIVVPMKSKRQRLKRLAYKTACSMWTKLIAKWPNWLKCIWFWNICYAFAPICK